MAKRRARRSGRQNGNGARTPSGDETARTLDGTAESSMVRRRSWEPSTAPKRWPWGAEAREKLAGERGVRRGTYWREAVTATFAGPRGVIAAAAGMVSDIADRGAGALRKPCRAPSSRVVASSGGWRRSVLSPRWNLARRNLRREAAPCSSGRPRAARRRGGGRPANRAPPSLPDPPELLTAHSTFRRHRIAAGRRVPASGVNGTGGHDDPRVRLRARCRLLITSCSAASGWRPRRTLVPASV